MNVCWYILLKIESKLIILYYTQIDIAVQQWSWRTCVLEFKNWPLNVVCNVIEGES